MPGGRCGEDRLEDRSHHLSHKCLRPPPPLSLRREIDAKYHVVDKTKAAAASGVARAKEMDTKYKITDKASAAVATGAMKIAAATSAKPAAKP